MLKKDKLILSTSDNH